MQHDHPVAFLVGLGEKTPDPVAGVGQGQGVDLVQALVSKACSSRPILAIDGCPLHCVSACLAQHGISADVHITLSSYGLRKRYREDCSAEEADALFADMSRIIASDFALSRNTEAQPMAREPLPTQATE
ncbi:MAG: hypothetical protein CVV17_12670 [Gammaproteobacteria bacterium HGW-Gammaproteobacteria-7]|nr:MAG: hypothetical protein CVV17_12670 [Gammaproteobacteria bacterium HGW-Gammaproteobacteria-7]